mgnify:CR=1 FL=1
MNREMPHSPIDEDRGNQRRSRRPNLFDARSALTLSLLFAGRRAFRLEDPLWEEFPGEVDRSCEDEAANQVELH